MRNQFKEILSSGRGTFLRKNDDEDLIIKIPKNKFKDVFLINGCSFLTEINSENDLKIAANDFYMVINNGKTLLEISYSKDIANHQIIYNPYKFENAEKKTLTAEIFTEKFNIPQDYIDTLPKWYSFKFTYKDYNLIFIKPEFGISIQIHKYRNEFWEILCGNPIIINGNEVYYFVKDGTKFEIPIGYYHSIINPNKEKFVAIRERWRGKFDEDDIIRVFNPNNYS